MLKYEKIEHDYDLPSKLIDIFEQSNERIVIDKHWHRSIELVIPLYGSGKIWINGKIINMVEGMVYIINSQDIHGFMPSDEKSAYKGYALQIDYDYIKSCYNDIDQIYFLAPSEVVNKMLMKRVIEIIRFYNDDDQFNKIRIKSHLQMLIFIMLDNLAQKRINYIPIKSNKNKKRIAKIIQYIEEHYQDDLSIQQIADYAQVTAGYLAKIFKDNLGISAKEYLTKVRLTHARDDLINTDYPIIDVLINNGFPNIKAFTTVFKKTYEVTPAKYREMMK